MICSSVVFYGEGVSKQNWTFSHITRPFSFIYYALSDHATYTFRGETARFRKNFLYLFPPNADVSFREDPDAKFEHLYIHAFLYPEFKNLVVIDPETDGFVKSTINMLRAFIQEKNPIYIRILSQMLVSYLFESDATDDSTLYVRMRQYIDKNFFDVFSNYNLPEVFSYSNSYLIKVFKDAYNITPKQYAKQLTLQHILQLLREGNPVNRIAASLNFSSPENFSRFFRNAYGCSPTDFLKTPFGEDVVELPHSRKAPPPAEK